MNMNPSACIKSLLILVVFLAWLAMPVSAADVMIGINPETTVTEDAVEWREGLIDTQSFTVNLSEYGEVFFASSIIPGDTHVAFRIIQNDQILEELTPYEVGFAIGQAIRSVDAVSFEDYNHDGNTDILVVLSWDNGQGGAVYMGTESDTSPKFVLQKELSDQISVSLSEVTISDMLSIIEHPTGIQQLLPFSEMKQFYFSSGAGAWGCEMELDPDGSFRAAFHDSEMGATGDGYNGSIYENSCTGKFDEITKISDTIYQMHLAEYMPEQEAGSSFIEDEILHVAADVYGVYPGTYFTLYLSDTLRTDLPQDLQNGWIMVAFTGENPDHLKNSILINEDTGAVFTG